MKKIIRNLLLIVCIGVFLFSAYNLWNIYMQYKEIDDEYANIQEAYVESKDDQYLQINWKKLKKRNKDVIGWIQIPDMKIDYPILQGANNDEYLRHDIDHKYLVSGCIFVDANNKEPFVDNNTIIYGHNMKNKSMFGQLSKLLDQEFVDEHPYVYIYLPNGTVSRYKIVVAHQINSLDDLYNTQVQDLKEYYQMMQKDNQISVEFDEEAENPVIMLSTCVNSIEVNEERYVLHAVLDKSGINPKKEKMIEVK